VGFLKTFTFRTHFYRSVNHLSLQLMDISLTWTNPIKREPRMTTTYVCRSHSRLVQVGEGPDPETFLVENLRRKTGKLIKLWFCCFRWLLQTVVMWNVAAKRSHIFSSQYNRTNSQNLCVLCFAPLPCFFLFLFLSCFLLTPPTLQRYIATVGPRF